MFIKIEKIVLIALSLFSLGVAGYLITNYLLTKSIRSTNVTRIAIFEPAIHPAIEEIAQGFINTLNQSGHPYEFKRYNANTNKILMHSLAEEIIQGNFDLIFTIGTGCSVTIKELCAKQQCTTPMVFSSIDDPQRLELNGPMITGVTEQTDYHKQLDLLIALKPSIKTVMLVYDPSQGSGFEKDKLEIESILKAKNIHLRAIEIHTGTEIQQKISSFMDESDVVMILKDHTAVSAIDSLITLCRRYHIPLFASDLNSGSKGAVLAYGVREYDSGAQAAQKAGMILELGKKPSEIPITAVQNLKMRINSKQMEAQGLIVDSDRHHLPDIEIE